VEAAPVCLALESSKGLLGFQRVVVSFTSLWRSTGQAGQFRILVAMSRSPPVIGVTASHCPPTNRAGIGAWSYPGG